MPPSGDSGMRIGRYELLDRIASGGMGEVFIARMAGPASFEKRVALKLLLPHLAAESDFVCMFLDEARIVARMSHPNIVPIFDLGSDRDRYFIAMELIEGVSLHRLLEACARSGRMLTLEICRLIANGLCEGLAYAHRLRDSSGKPDPVIHRDVSPSNLLVSTTGGVYLTDFGIAKAKGNLHRTETGTVRGKYAYMAPEQLASNAAVDHRVDIYAAALTIFEALTLVSPFKRASDAEVMDAVRYGERPDPRSRRAELGASAAEALCRSLERDPERRFQNITELRDALLDGPMAPPHELGALVSELCPRQLAVFQAQRVPAVAGPDDAPRTMTRAGPADPPTLPATQVDAKPRRRAALAALLTVAALAAVGGVAAGWLGGGDEATAPDRAEAADAVRARAGSLAATDPAPGDGRAPVRRGDEATQTRETPVFGVESRAAAHDLGGRGDAPAEGPDAGDAGGAEGVRFRRQTPDGLAAAGAGTVEGAPPAARPQDRAPSVAVRRRPAVGYLTADASPWAVVLLGTKELERTPFAKMPLPPGSYTLTFKNPTAPRPLTRTVRIESGKTTTVRVEF